MTTVNKATARSHGTAGPERPPPDLRPFGGPRTGWRQAVYRVTFLSETRAGRMFDIVLIMTIIASVIVVFADSVPALHARHAAAFEVAEWTFTALFTLEYALRISCVRRPGRYARSFFGVIDLIAILPTYLALLIPGIHVLIDVRVLRLLRIFRILKLTAYISEYQILARAISASSRKIFVFLSVIVMIVVVMGSLMYVIEGPEHGFTSIPMSIYWAVTTMTTVGYGDITPQSPLGRLLTTMMMLVGWGTLAVPTGIVTSEVLAHRRTGHDGAAGLPGLGEVMGGAGRPCPSCGHDSHVSDARFCHRCGAALPA